MNIDISNVAYWQPIAVRLTKRNIRSFVRVKNIYRCFVHCSLVIYASGGGTRDTTIPHWVGGRSAVPRIGLHSGYIMVIYVPVPVTLSVRVTGLNSTVGAKRLRFLSRPHKLFCCNRSRSL